MIQVAADLPLGIFKFSEDIFSSGVIRLLFYSFIKKLIFLVVGTFLISLLFFVFMSQGDDNPKITPKLQKNRSNGSLFYCYGCFLGR